MKLQTFAIAALLSLSGLARAAALSPIGVSILAPIQFPAHDVWITGVRVNLIYGVHREVYGFDLGAIGNITEQEFKGLAQVAGIFNYNGGYSTHIGAQVAGIANININQSRIVGLQAALAFNRNDADQTIVGLQLAGFANLSKHSTIIGAQVGAYNVARTVWGFQIGLVNVAEFLHGLQIGLLNFHKNGLFSVCPLINFGF